MKPYYDEAGQRFPIHVGAPNGWAVVEVLPQ